MKIKWFGHSAFGLTSVSGTAIITDPYESGGYNGAVGYKPIAAGADAVTISHNHADHNYIKALPGKPTIIDKKGNYEIAGIKITGIPVYHDARQGRDRGDNIVFIYEIDGLRIAHCGDIGHILAETDVEALGAIDILLIPTGGHFTIDARQATDVISSTNPKIVIPMHYKTEALDFPIAGVDEFLQGKNNIKKFSTPEVSVTPETLPPETEIWILPYA